MKVSISRFDLNALDEAVLLLKLFHSFKKSNRERLPPLLFTKSDRERLTPSLFTTKNDREWLAPSLFTKRVTVSGSLH